ncbi:MAG: hypothetical protein VYA71_01840 [Pseudomonadota bacterium]|nr:hypothetical protein [Pseudomonadota bacterium]
MVTVDGEAWSLTLLRDASTIRKGNMVMTWTTGQASALDTATIAGGADVGNVVVQRKLADGSLEDVAYSVNFAFAFHAFNPDTPIHVDLP